MTTLTCSISDDYDWDYWVDLILYCARTSIFYFFSELLSQNSVDFNNFWLRILTKLAIVFTALFATP